MVAGQESRAKLRGRRVQAGGAGLSVGALLGLVVTAIALAVTGALTQLSGKAGCVSDDGTSGTCRDGKELTTPQEVAVSPDGQSVYVDAVQSNAVDVFKRDTTTGALTQLSRLAGCVSEDGSGGVCRDGKALGQPDGVTVSPDGKSVYAASFYSNAIAVFARQSP
jgi:DNA-binding beta-propeller fold protein YncE